jgi:hypothetical protein
MTSQREPSMDDHFSRHPNLRLGPKAERHNSRLRMACPHCGSFSRVRKSEAITPTYRELRLVCSNDACGHVWVAGLEALRTLCPSDQPNPEIHIPLGAAIRAAIAEPSSTPVAAG